MTNSGIDAASTLTRLVSVVVLIIAFIATKPITLQNADSLLIFALVIAAVAGAGLAYMINRNADLTWPSAAALARAASVIAGCLVTLAILRTVLPAFTGQYEDEILGLAFIVLLLIVFAFTERSETQPASEAPATPAPVRSPDGGPDPNQGGGTSGAQNAQSATRIGFTATLVAIAVVIGYGFVVAMLIQRSAVPDDQWARLVGIQGGLEAAAFAALGALIGVSIQGRAIAAVEQQVVEAEDDAKTAEADAVVATEDADNKAAELEAAATKLTELERSLSDETVPGDLRELGIDVDAVGILPIREIRRRSHASDEAFLAELRAVRDEVAKAATTRPRRRR